MAAFMDETLKSLLEATGGADDIYNAMDSDDFAVVVRAATGALKKTLSIPMRLVYENKSKEGSNKIRNIANRLYVNGKYKEALIGYNMALVCAPKGSLELTLAYSNISAVLLVIKAYQGCQLNIAACRALDCPRFLIAKLDKRMEESNIFVQFEDTRVALFHRERFLKNFLDFNVKKNADVPCASEDVTVAVIDGRKKVVAARDIASGTLVALERAFVSASYINRFVSCYHCQTMSFFNVPCEGCHALFCSKECMNKCMEEYHHIECQIKTYMGTLYKEPVNKLTVQAAIKISLKLKWEELSVVSKELCAERWKKYSAKEAFDAEVPTSILYNDEQREVSPGRIFNGSLYCAGVVDCLQRVPGYFPEEKKKRQNAMDALSRVMLHLYTTFTNKLEIICSAYNNKSNQLKLDFQINYGWFSFTSKLAHSCEPNLYVLGLNDQVALVALQRIKKGDELTISYISHFYDTDISTLGDCPSRKEFLMGGINLRCDCRVCEQNWDSNSHVRATNLTRRQKSAVEKVKAATSMKACSMTEKFKVAAAALDELTGLYNTTEHKMAYRQLIDAILFCDYLCTV